jgi:hypothetical protein
MYTTMDINEMVQEPFNPLGTTAHEVAHQFHSMIYGDPTARPLFDCIEKLFQSAKTRDQFFTPYSSTNTEEYFAEAFGAGGFNMADLEKVDPNLQVLKSQILKGDLLAVTCPLK